MSIQAIAWALEQNVPDPAAKLVLIALANAFNQQRGRCFPTVRQIMKEASTSERTVQRKIKLLAEMGFITIESTHDPKGRQLANDYRLNMSGEGVNLTGAALGGCHGDTLGGANGDTLGGVSCDTPLKEPEEVPEEKTLGASAPSEPALPDRFEEFRSVYPKREGGDPKKPAREAFHRAVRKGHDPDVIIQTAREFSRRHSTPTRFIPRSTTWLNDEAFLDEISSRAAPAAADREMWAKRMHHGRTRRLWFPGEWGPKPGESGCVVPADLLQPLDGVGWMVKQREAA